MAPVSLLSCSVPNSALNTPKGHTFVQCARWADAIFQGFSQTHSDRQTDRHTHTHTVEGVLGSQLSYFHPGCQGTSHFSRQVFNAALHPARAQRAQLCILVSVHIYYPGSVGLCSRSTSGESLGPRDEVWGFSDAARHAARRFPPSRGAPEMLTHAHTCPCALGGRCPHILGRSAASQLMRFGIFPKSSVVTKMSCVSIHTR